MSALADAELHRLIAEDCPYGDLTTATLGIAAFPARPTFRSRGPMTVAGIEEAARMFALVDAEASAEVKAGADIVVTSWPYTARPCDVKVEFERG